MKIHIFRYVWQKFRFPPQVPVWVPTRVPGGIRVGIPKYPGYPGYPGMTRGRRCAGSEGQVQVVVGWAGAPAPVASLSASVS
eukprot:3865614-Rhodomonas_salina.1